MPSKTTGATNPLPQDTDKEIPDSRASYWQGEEQKKKEQMVQSIPHSKRLSSETKGEKTKSADVAQNATNNAHPHD
jgi:hypothetical protein